MVKSLNANAYVQAQAGIINNPVKESYGYAGVALGGNLNFKGTYLNAQAGIGSALFGEVKLGHEFDIGKNMGLDLSAKASANISNNTKSKTFNFGSVEKNISLDEGKTNIHLVIPEGVHKYEWTPGEERLCADAKLTYKTSNAKFGLGLEAGQRKTWLDKNMSIETEDSVTYSPNDNEQIGATYSLQETRKSSVNNYAKQTYITPTASVEVNFGKNDKFSFVANADMYQGQAGIRYTF